MATNALWSGGLLVLLAGSIAHAQSVNGGFESGTGTDADNWSQLEIFNGSGNAMADRVMTNPASGDWHMAFSVTGAGDGFGPVAEIQQQTAVGSVNPGNSYDFSFLATGVAGPGSVAFYEVSWFDGDGSNGGGPQGSATGLQVFGLTPAYQSYGQSALVAPAGADSVFISIRIVTGAFDGAFGSMDVDDVSFTPAPGALLVAGMSGCFMLGRRRRA
ncbi:MAG: hypothetical protein KDA21_14330 [Phycisphaerales bacterium]|nr:hypothetical protein [Phycisphaerales bacterium]